jgi:hypothetical protein
MSGFILHARYSDKAAKVEDLSRPESFLCILGQVKNNQADVENE